MWYIRVDVHLKSSSVCVLDEHGHRIKQKKVQGPWPKLVEWIEDVTEPISVCYEASCGYGPIYDALSRVPNGCLDDSANSRSLNLTTASSWMCHYSIERSRRLSRVMTEESADPLRYGFRIHLTAN